MTNWHCNICDRGFAEVEAALVDVDDESGECVIACPFCWTSILDDEDALELVSE